VVLAGYANSGPNSDFAVARFNAGMEERLYFQQDANFNVTSITNVSGSVLERYRYTPYGERTVLNADFSADTLAGSDSTTGDDSAAGPNMSDYLHGYGHQGGETDAATGLMLFRHREYHATIGRWGQRDPAGYVDSFSLYESLTSNPGNLVDPSGLEGDGTTLGIYDPDKDPTMVTGEQLRRGGIIGAGNSAVFDPDLSDDWIPDPGSEEVRRADVERYRRRERYERLRKYWDESLDDWLAAINRFEKEANKAVREHCNDTKNGLLIPIGAMVLGSLAKALQAVGRRGNPINVVPGTNAPREIGGRNYRGHALDQMQARGVPSSAVENTIRHGTPGTDPIPGRIRHYDPVNDLTVVTESGTVVTVITGQR
jgi:RHS repeat-associated protein